MAHFGRLARRAVVGACWLSRPGVDIVASQVTVDSTPAQRDGDDQSAAGTIHSAACNSRSGRSPLREKSSGRVTEARDARQASL